MKHGCWSGHKGLLFTAIHSRQDWDNPLVTEGHFHDHYELMYYIRGELSILIEETPYEVRPGDIVLIESRRMHSFTYPIGVVSERIGLSFNRAFLRTLVDSEVNLAVFAEFRAKDKVVHLESQLLVKADTVLREMVAEYQYPDDDSEDMCRFLLGRLLLLLKRHAQFREPTVCLDDKPSLAAVSQIVAYIRSNLCDDLSLSTLADRFCFSNAYLARIFRRHTGFTVTEYVHNARVAESAGMLAKTRTPITDIAGIVGFDNITHFGRVFRKVMGTSPRSYRTASGRR